MQSLAEHSPALVSERAQDLNGDLHPSDVSYGSIRPVWWRCSKNHTWETTPNQRTRPDSPRGCPYCAHRWVLPGYSDLATLRPDLAEEWHPERNGTLTPAQVSPGSTRRVWWAMLDLLLRLGDPGLLPRPDRDRVWGMCGQARQTGREHPRPVSAGRHPLG